ncbi:MAG: UbiA family prenyltransferase, partial [Chloroflexota bacterium]|nr:UbiA family prenyltransferase [Chloroflexota bacterium]
ADAASIVAAVRNAIFEWAEFLHLRAIPVVVVAALAFVWIAARGAPPPGPTIGFLAAVLLTQVAIALDNNWCDRDLDAATKPWRLIPRGVVSARAAQLGSWLFLAAGIIVSLAVSPAVAALVALGTACGFVYDHGVDRTIASIVPFAIALPTLAVAAFAVVGRADLLVPVAYLVGAPLVVAIHLADAIPDIVADRSAGASGLAARLGSGAARAVCWAAFALAATVIVLIRPRGGSPGILLVAGLALFGVALALARRPHVHRVLLSLAALALAADWLGDLAAG